MVDPAYAGKKYTIRGQIYQIPRHLTFTDPQFMLEQYLLDGLYDLLRCVTTLAHEHQITMFAVGGTLLSAIRHGALMPWDDDLDMGYMIEEHGRISGLRLKLFMHGYHLFEGQGWFIIQHILLPTISMDVYAFSQQGHRYRFASPVLRQLYPNEWLPTKHLTQSRICGLPVNVPQNPKRYLQRVYSKNVLHEVRGIVSTNIHKFRYLQCLLPILDRIVPTDTGIWLYNRLT